MISRRELLRVSALLSLCYPFANFKYSAVADEKTIDSGYPLTLSLLREVYWVEMAANKHYEEFCRKALSENYPNIAYLFYALSISEKIHAESFKNLIISFNSSLEDKEIPVSFANTKTNLKTAAIKELEKINKFYPDILDELSSESHDQTILYCMYSWKSHKQHEEIIRDIRRYSGLFFWPLARKIESLNPNYYVCEICGSTVDEKPAIPCEICNYPVYHYQQVERPVLMAK